jgi:hypothetical protein
MTILVGAILYELDGDDVIQNINSENNVGNIFKITDHYLRG